MHSKIKPEEALVQFLSKALQKRWRDRYISLIQTKRGKQTFLSDLWHRFEDRLDHTKVVSDLPDDVWESQAFSFSQDNGFGRKEESVRAAFNSVGDGSLIIDISGSHGIHQPEDMVDNLKCFSV